MITQWCLAERQLLLDLVMRHKDVIQLTLQNTQKITQRTQVALVGYFYA